MQKLQHRTCSFGDFTLDLTRGCLLRGGEEVKLRPQSFEVMKYLVENSGRVVYKDELHKAVWRDDTAVTDDSLVQCIIDVRKALGDDEKRMVKNVPRRGYIFETEATWHEPAGREAVYTEEVKDVRGAFEEGELKGGKTEPAMSPAPRSGLRSPLWARKLALACVVAIAFAAVALVLYRHRPDPGEIKVKLTQQEQLHLAKARQNNPEAYDSYLRGKFYFNRYTEKDSERAIENLERAVATDSGFAEAHAALALASQYKFVNFKPEEKQWQEKIFVEVEKALALDPDLADAYIVRGRTLWTHANHFQHEEAIREYRRALSLNPNSDEAFFQIGLIYNHIGLFDKAHQEFQKAIAINPNNVRARWFFGQTFLYQGKYREFLATSRNLPREMNPHMTGYQIAWASFQLGRKDEALATLAEFLRGFSEDTPGTLTSMQAVIFAASGDRSKAEEKIKIAVERERDSIQFHHTAYNIGAAYALMNKAEQAIKWLQSAAEDGFPCYPVFETDPNLNNIRQDPRFVKFIAKLKEQWERYKTTL